ncbi:MAG: type II secretion system protein [Candidatus Omnitrophota bacterium]
MKKRGFTLIELLIVIAILGILVALILPRFSDVREDANKKVCIANLRGLTSAMATYEVKTNNPGNWGVNSDPELLVTWEYIAAEPYCPNDTAKANPYTLVVAVSPEPAKAICPFGPDGDNTLPTHDWP